MRNISRPCEPEPPSLEIDLLWSDPQGDMAGWRTNDWGVAYVFGADVVREFCDRQGVDLIARAHQVVQDGYEFFCDRKLVTIFSAPRYCGEFDNDAAVMTVSKHLLCSFDVLKSTHKAIRISPVQA